MIFKNCGEKSIVINDFLNFLIIAFVVFLIVQMVSKLKSKPEEDAETKECPACISQIPIKATRCANCCVDLQT